MNKKDINKELIGPNIFALYQNGEFQTTKHIRDGWLMLIDIGRGQHTVVEVDKVDNPIKEYGLLWRKHDSKYTDTFLFIDDNWMVHQSVEVKQADFDKVKNGTYHGLMEMTRRFFMWRDGKLEDMLR